MFRSSQNSVAPLRLRIKSKYNEDFVLFKSPICGLLVPIPVELRTGECGDVESAVDTVGSGI